MNTFRNNAIRTHFIHVHVRRSLCVRYKSDFVVRCVRVCDIRNRWPFFHRFFLVFFFGVCVCVDPNDRKSIRLFCSLSVCVKTFSIKLHGEWLAKTTNKKTHCEHSGEPTFHFESNSPRSSSIVRRSSFVIHKNV